MAGVIEKPHLSASQIGMLLRCPRQYMYRYVMGISSPPSGAMAQSSAWHAAIEHGYRHKIQTGDLPTESLTVDVFADKFDQIFRGDAPSQDDGIQLPELPSLHPGESIPDLKDSGVRYTRLHRQRLAPANVPRLVEHRFSVSLGEEFPFVLEGIWDLVEHDGTIVDNKALSRSPSTQDMASSIQLTAYSLAYRLLEGRQEPALRFDLVVKTKTPQAKRLLTTRTDGELRWFIGLVEQVARQILSGIFPPNPTGWWCDPKFCGYFARCKGGTAREDA